MNANTIEHAFESLPCGTCFTRDLTGSADTPLRKVDATTARTPWGMLVGIYWSDEPVLVHRTALGRLLAHIAYWLAAARYSLQNT